MLPTLTSKQILTLVVVILIVFIAGYYTGKTSAMNNFSDFIKNKTTISKTFPEPVSEPNAEGININGTIKEVTGDYIIIETRTSTQVESLEEESPQAIQSNERKVVITKDTELVKIDLLSTAKSAEERKDVTEEPLVLSELKKGDNVHVTYTQNIEKNNELTATKILLIILDLP